MNLGSNKSISFSGTWTSLPLTLSNTGKVFRGILGFQVRSFVIDEEDAPVGGFLFMQSR